MNNDDPPASIIRRFLPLSNLRFSTSFYFFKFQNENIWLKLRACYINGNIQMKDHQWNSDEVCIDIVKNDENIYMFTNIYGASFYF